MRVAMASDVDPRPRAQPESTLDGAPDAARQYAPPQSLPQATKAKDAELETVRVAEELDPRRMPTMVLPRVQVRPSGGPRPFAGSLESRRGRGRAGLSLGMVTGLAGGALFVGAVGAWAVFRQIDRPRPAGELLVAATISSPLASSSASVMRASAPAELAEPEPEILSFTALEVETGTGAEEERSAQTVSSRRVSGAAPTGVRTSTATSPGIAIRLEPVASASASARPLSSPRASAPRTSTPASGEISPTGVETAEIADSPPPARRIF